ncbi:hypothetical protein K438DRAFT_2051129 [Mycena galopus ATCC 62051]|nr:hypothetical protein K438DRAFT_2051129 [Mycena galopus ATCC 62051]
MSESRHTSDSRAFQRDIPRRAHPTDPKPEGNALPIPLPGNPNPMMDALRQFSHRTRTENDAPAFNSTLSPTLDAFNQLTHFSLGSKVGDLLDKAWAEDSELTLKIIWNLRSIHEGKAEKEAFYRAFGWLYDNHPRTAISNLHLLVERVCVKSEEDVGRSHGYWKDLLNILALATVDELSNMSEPATFLHNFSAEHKARRKARKQQPATTNLDTLGITVDLKSVVKAQRAAVGAAYHARIERKLEDPKYRALYVAVARLFAQRLLDDWLSLLNSETAEDSDARKDLLRNISLAPKWAPSLQGSQKPEFVRLDPAASLYGTIRTMERSDWGANTDISAVFLRLLLPLAIQNKVSQEDMIRRVFVFSDMQFDQGTMTPGSWETNYDVIEREFKAAGYEVPEIVYWNLSRYDTVEVAADRKGVAMMSGFSPSMLKIFMGEEVEEVAEPEQEESDGEASQVENVKPEFNPLNVMKKALSRPSFDGLVVVD